MGDLANQIERQPLQDVPLSFIDERRTYNGTFARDLRLVIQDIRQQINAVPSNSNDPISLASTLYALDTWYNRPFAYGFDNFTPAVPGIRTFAPGTNKCSRFVGDAYALGGRIGYKDIDFLGRYPTRKSRNFTQSPYPISAEELLSGNNIPAFPITRKPKIGDLVIFPPPESNLSGHVGINLGRGIYISARHLGGSSETTQGVQYSDGVMITKIPYSQYTNNPIIYRTFNTNYSINMGR
jgi:hypothetical protein